MPNALAHLLVLEALVLNEKDRTTTQAITIDKFRDTYSSFNSVGTKNLASMETKVEKMHQP